MEAASAVCPPHLSSALSIHQRHHVQTTEASGHPLSIAPFAAPVQLQHHCPILISSRSSASSVSSVSSVCLARQTPAPCLAWPHCPISLARCLLALPGPDSDQRHRNMDMDMDMHCTALALRPAACICTCPALGPALVLHPPCIDVGLPRRQSDMAAPPFPPPHTPRPAPALFLAQAHL